MVTGSACAPLSANAREVLARRYLVRDDAGRVIETPEQMFRRVARALAAPAASHGATQGEIDAVKERFFRRMSALELVPNSPTLMNAGRSLGQLAACFVVPVGDSTEAIFQAVAWAAAIQKTGGGTGFDFSRLRPAGDRVESTGGVASGPVLFMQVFDIGTEAVKQGGTRRGANMGILRVDHPDILDFIGLKLDPDKMRNFNLSVAVTDSFMDALARDADYELINPRTGEPVRALHARRVFEAMVNAAWATGDPGVVFIDAVNRDNPTPTLGDIAATNPCGEQPLLPFESCTLASIDLGRFAGAGGEVDWSRLREAIRDGVELLDNVIDANRYPLPAIAEATRATRKIGLGVMGWADLLINLGIPYDDPRALELGDRVAAFLTNESVARSVELAEVRGPFPAWEGSRWAERGIRLRNATTTTVAPTGTISIIAGCSSGIEPLYAVAYERNVLDGTVLPELHPGFRARTEALGIFTPELEAELVRRGGVRGWDRVPAELQALFPTALDLSPATHIEMQAIFQRHVHAAVSKTINLRRDATPAQVAQAYQLAYARGCKGITVYRDGSRAGQVLAVATGDTAGAAAGEQCPECGAVVPRQQGCVVCRSCGWSVCHG